MYYLIDYENVHESGLDAIEILNEQDKIFLFFNPDNCCIHKYKLDAILKNSCSVEFVQLVKPGSNALDFYIAVKVGQIIASDPSANIQIISNDKGFSSISDYVSAYNNTAFVVCADSLSGCQRNTETLRFVNLSEDHFHVWNATKEAVETSNATVETNEDLLNTVAGTAMEIIRHNNGVISASSLFQELRKNAAISHLLDGVKHKVVFLGDLLQGKALISGKNGNEHFSAIGFARSISNIHGLTKQQVKSLHDAGIINIEDLVKLGDDDLLKIKYIGKKTVKLLRCV